jgi:hypothetical protein
LKLGLLNWGEEKAVTKLYWTKDKRRFADIVASSTLPDSLFPK